jgi:Fur family ferric uptake transcriptional regulator
MSKQQDILDSLRTAGYKLTPQRRAIVGAVLASGRSLTPQDLHATLAKNNPEIGLVTVYRTLEILNGLGLLCQFQPEGGSRTFKAGPAEHHHHLVCRGCGEVVDFTGHCPVELESSLEQETGFQITDHRLEFSGYCKECRRR